MAGKLILLTTLLIGVLVGVAVVQTQTSAAAANTICNNQLPGDNWTANLTASDDHLELTGGALVCEHQNGTARTITVNADITIASEELS